MSKDKPVSRANSKAPLLNFTWGTNTQTVFPDFDANKVLQMINEDPVARGAFLHKVDKCMEGDYAVLKRDSLAYDKEFELLLDTKHKFRQDVLRKTFLYLSLFNNAYIEIVRSEDANGNKITKAINVLDTPNVAPITEPNGDPIAYRLVATPVTADPEWSKDDIVWIKLNDRNRGIAPIDMQALWKILHLKKYILRYTGWLWETGQYRIAHILDNSSNNDVEGFLAYNRKADSDFSKPFLAKGKYETKMLRDMKETEHIVSLLKWIDNEICVLLRVPPIDAGIPDASGRSNADAQSNNFHTHIGSIRKLVEDAINFDLFPKINKGNNLIRFGPTDRFAEKQVFEVIQIMQSVGLKPEVMTEYLKDKGIFFEDAEIFAPRSDQMMPGASNNPRSKDMAPSRQGKGTGEANAKIGTGSQGTTRDDQL